MRRMKWISCATAASILSIVMLGTACGSSISGTEDKDRAEAADTGQTMQMTKQNFDPLGKYDPPIEVTAIRPADATMKFENGETIEKNGWTHLYENELGIKLRYLWISDQFEQRMNVTMASGKLPDIMPLNGIQLRQLAEAGQLADLTEALEKYGSQQLKNILNKDGGIAQASATFGDKLLALPVLVSYTDSAPLLWIRTDWLEKLNLPEPKTMDDVFTIAEAFVTRDPDGNDMKDTYGLGISKEIYNSLAGLEGFFNGYHAYPNIWIKDSAGKTVYGSVQPEMKAALAKLQQMYKSGWIDHDFAVKAPEKVGQDMNAGKLGMMYGAHWVPLFLQDGKNWDTSMQWKPFLLPSIDGQPAQPQARYDVSQYYAVRKGMEHPEAAVKMLNAFLHRWDRNRYPQSMISINGQVEKWRYALLFNANPTQNLDAFKKVNEALQKHDESILDPNTGEPAIYKAVKAYLNGDQSGWSYERIFGAEGAQSLYDNYKNNNQFKITEFIGSPTPTMVERGIALTKMEFETFTKIIMGETSIDAFDEFVTNWNKLGGAAITKEVEQWKAGQ